MHRTTRSLAKNYNMALLDIWWPADNPQPETLIPFNQYPGSWVTVEKNGKKFMKWSKV